MGFRDLGNLSSYALPGLTSEQVSPAPGEGETEDVVGPVSNRVASNDARCATVCFVNYSATPLRITRLGQTASLATGAPYNSVSCPCMESSNSPKFVDAFVRPGFRIEEKPRDRSG